MKILRVKVKTNSGRDAITEAKSAGIDLLISVKALAEKGSANRRVLEMLAKYFKLPVTSLEI